MSIFVYENEFVRICSPQVDEDGNTKNYPILGRVPSIAGNMIWWGVGRIAHVQNRWMWKNDNIYVAPEIILEVVDLLVKLEAKEIVIY